MAHRDKIAAKCLMEIDLFIKWLRRLCHFQRVKAIQTAQMFFSFKKLRAPAAG
jgi:hypothetical protein